MSYWNFANLTTRNDWDNVGKGTYPAPEKSKHYTHDPHASFEACRLACESVPECLQYQHHLRRCKLDKSLRYGSHREPELGKVGKDITKAQSELEHDEDDLKFRSGWVQDRVTKWMDDRRCEKVKWVRPSLDRVF